MIEILSAAPAEAVAKATAARVAKSSGARRMAVSLVVSISPFFVVAGGGRAPLIDGQPFIWLSIDAAALGFDGALARLHGRCGAAAVGQSSGNGDEGLAYSKASARSRDEGDYPPEPAGSDGPRVE